MKKICVFMLCFCVLILSVVCDSYAQSQNDDNITYGGSVEVTSRNYWRGQYWTDGLAWMPSAWLSHRGLYSTFWGRMPLEDVAYQGQFHCAMNNTYYRFVVDNVGIKAGFITYFYPYVPGWSTTGEVYGGLDYTVGVMTIATNHYFDVVDYTGAYYGDVSVAYNQPFADVFTVSSVLSTGWGNATFNNTYSGHNAWADRYIGIDLSIKSQLTDNVFVKPYFHYDVVSGTGLRNSLGDTNILSVGVVVGVHN